MKISSSKVSASIRRVEGGQTEEGLVMESLFWIVDKDTNDIPFRLNSTQYELDRNLTGRDLIPKARQEGVSFYFLYRYLAACLLRKNVRAVIISHQAEATQKLLNRVKYAIDNINGPAPVIKNRSANEITFAKTNSTIYIGTAGSGSFGRGDTITHLHCSEYAYWPNPKKLLAGLLQAVPKSGEVAIESTGNGSGNDYHRRCMRAESGQSAYALHFFNWLHFPEYSLHLEEEEEQEIMNNLDPHIEEPELINILTPGQFAWRREKLDELDYDLGLFKQEYPITLDECFQASGRSLFTKVLYNRDDPKWQKVDANLVALEGHPKKGFTYSLGADVAAGVGQDRSVSEVYCLDTAEQVAEWVSDRIEPDVFASKIEFLGKLYNEAYVTVEANNHGIVTLDILMENYPPALIYDTRGGTDRDLEPSLMQMGFRTTAKSKPMIIGKLRKFLARYYSIYSAALKSELDSFIEHPTGKIGADEGCHDDRVIASACAIWGIERAGLLIEGEFQKESDPAADPFCLDHIIEERLSLRKKAAVSDQHSVAEVVEYNPQHRN